MLQITKQILCFVVCVAITCGCTTTQTKTFVNFTDNGKHRTPVVSYHSHQTTVKRRESMFLEHVFPLWRAMYDGEDEKDEKESPIIRAIFATGGELFASAMMMGFPIVIDILSIPVTAVMYKTYTSVNYDTQLHLRGKLVDADNKPLANYAFQVTSYQGISSVKTDSDGVFDVKLWSLDEPTSDKEVTFLFPNKNVRSIVYEAPFTNGVRNTVFPTDYGVHQSSIPATGNVIVLDKQPVPPAFVKKAASSAAAPQNKSRLSKTSATTNNHVYKTTNQRGQAFKQWMKNSNKGRGYR